MEGREEGTMDGGTQIEGQSPNKGSVAVTVQTPHAASDPRLAWSRYAPLGQ